MTRYTQPQAGPGALDWGNPITNGTVVEFVASLGTQNLVTGKQFTLVGAPTRTTTIDGIAESFVRASTQGLSVGTDSAYNPPNMTLMVIYTPTLSSGGAGHTLFARDDNTLGRAFTLDLHWAANFGVRYYVAGGGTSGTNELREGVTATVGRRYVIIATQSGNTAKLWVDGKLVASSTSFTAKPSATGDTRIGIRTYSGSNEPCNGNIPLARMLNRVLSDTEIAQAFANPWQFIADEDTSWLKVTSGGGSNTYTLSVGGTFTLSGAASYLHERQQVPSGSVTFSGTNFMVRNRVTIPTGSVIFSGSATEIKNKVIPAGGTVNFSGTAPLINPNVGTTVTTWRTMTGAGF